mgnify:CR=1|jgi:hypothetical protein
MSFSQNLLDNYGLPDYEIIDKGIIERIKAIYNTSAFSDYLDRIGGDF